MEKKVIPYARTDFGPPPPGYIAGLGRGAVGFITRADIGPSSQGGQSNSFMPQENENEVLNDAMYDEWNGYSQSLFQTGDDIADQEADEIYRSIDKRLDERRKERRDKKIKEELKKISKEKPTIAQKFADLKRELSQISYEEWQSIPESGDFSTKKQKKDKYIPVPDTVIDGGRKDISHTSSVQQSNEGDMTSIANLNDLGSARNKVMSLKLDQTSDSVAGTSVVDKKGYLTDLARRPVNNLADIGDFKKARAIMKSVINTNPKNPDGWIAAARIEELDGNIKAARNILSQGLSHCETSDDLWIETVRIEHPEKQKALLAKAIQVIPKSIKLWMTAVSKEEDKAQKKKILKKALEHLPNHPRLWKELIEMEEDQEEAKTLLYKAVECIPHNLEMWLALSKLENYKNAQAVLNRARKTLPTEHSIWIAASKLQEAQGVSAESVEQLIVKAIQILKKNGYVLNRDEWIEEAEIAERSGSPINCVGIIKAVLHEGVAEIDRFRIYCEDIVNLAERKSMLSARAAYNHAIEVFGGSKQIFMKAIDLESKYANKDEKNYLDQILEKALQMHSEDEGFWLTCIKRMWENKDKARQVIQNSLNTLPNSVQILILASKLEREDKQIEKARQYIQEAKQKTQEVGPYINAIKIELYGQNYELAFNESQTALKIFASNAKLIILAAKVTKKVQGIDRARKIFEQGLMNTQINDFSVWSEYILMEIKEKNFTRVRPILEKARLKHPKNVELWRLAVLIEINSSNVQAAGYALSRALKECPADGELWSISIELEPKASRKKKIVDALKQGQNDPYINISVAKLFWKERKLEKAKKWIEKALMLDSSIADSWACLYLFELTHSEDNNATANQLLQKILTDKPKKGRLWERFKKTEEGIKLDTKDVLHKVISILQEELNRIE